MEDSRPSELSDRDARADARGPRRPASVLRLPFHALRLSLVSNAFYLIVNTAVGALLGAAFWLVAARFYSETDVGFAAAVIPIASFIAGVGGLGLPTGLIRFFPRTAGDPRTGRAILNGSMTLTGLTGGGLAIAFVLGSRLWAPGISPVLGDPTFFAAFVVYGALFAAWPIVDAISLAARRAEFVFARHTVYNLLRPTLPIAFAGAFGAFGLFSGVVLAGLVAWLLGLFVLLPRLVAGYRPAATLRLSPLRPLVRFSLGNHVAALLGGIAPAALPLLILQLRSPAENAWFYIAWFLGTMLYVIPGAFSTSLFIEGSQVDPDVPRDVRRTILASAVLVLPAAAFLYFAGDRLLAVFGPSYAAGGFTLLRWLVAATPFVLIASVYVTLVRVENRVAPVIAVAGFGSAFSVGASLVLLSDYGLPGVGIAWFVGQALVALAIGVATAIRGTRTRAGARG